MVRHEHGGRTYWTLPGGGVEPGELFELAVVREVREETGLNVSVVRLLWEGEVGQFYERVFLLSERKEREAVLGMDPELSPDKQILKGVRWFSLQEKRDDVQVSKLIAVMEEGGS